MLAWVRSEAGRDAAARLVRKYGLAEEPLDLVSIASEKINASLNRRIERIPSVVGAMAAMLKSAEDSLRRRRPRSIAKFDIVR